MLRIGSVPYLNAKPLVDWFHSPECDAPVEITYAVPSQLAQMLRTGELDVANVSIFEALQNPRLRIVPNISISATGAVKSVRLFSKKPLAELESVALDTSSLTSVALTRILLKEVFGVEPRYQHHDPNLSEMLEENDAGLIIGDLKLFDLLPNTQVYDLGQGWYDLTGLPFVYAAWLAREEVFSPEMTALLERAKVWGVARREQLAEMWAERMGLPKERCLDYLLNVMDYDLTPRHFEGLRCYQQKCVEYGLIAHTYPLR
jgi:chorismate dehydratase